MTTTYERYLSAFGMALQGQPVDLSAKPSSDLLAILRGIDDGMFARNVLLRGGDAGRHPLSERMLAVYVESVNATPTPVASASLTTEGAAAGPGDGSRALPAPVDEFRSTVPVA